MSAAWLPLAGLAICLGSGCATRGTSEATGPPNIILISIDTLRADHLGSYGYSRDTSPFMDSLALRGVRFENAFAQSSWTLPSHMSLMTSTYPMTHQVESEDRSLPATIPTLAEQLQEGGYETTAFVSWIYVLARYGFGRGFDAFHELLPSEEQQDDGTHHSIKANDFVDEVSAWAVGRTGRPFFLFLHLFDPHLNYEPPLQYARRFDPEIDSVAPGSYDHLKQYIRGLSTDAARVPSAELARAKALYDGEIRFTDDQLERLFETLGEANLLENTVVVLTSDHGEEFDEHGSMEGHQWTLYDEVLRIPLILVLPGDEHAGTRVARMVQSIDVAPTLLELAGLPAPEGFEGRSLLRLLDKVNEVEWQELAISNVRRFNLKWSLRTPQHKLIYTKDTQVNSWGVPVRAGWEMYDLQNDPAERSNIFDPHREPELVQQLRSLIEKRPPTVETPRPELSPEEIERLRSLGYVQ